MEIGWFDFLFENDLVQYCPGDIRLRLGIFNDEWRSRFNEIHHIVKNDVRGRGSIVETPIWVFFNQYRVFGKRFLRFPGTAIGFLQFVLPVALLQASGAGKDRLAANLPKGKLFYCSAQLHLNTWQRPVHRCKLPDRYRAKKCRQPGRRRVGGLFAIAKSWEEEGLTC